MKSAKENATPEAAGPLKIKVAGVEREFDINDPELPEWVEKNTLSSGGYPYDKKMKEEEYEENARAAAGRTGEVAILAAGIGEPGADHLRGPRRRRQGRDDRRDAATT